MKIEKIEKLHVQVKIPTYPMMGFVTLEPCLSNIGPVRLTFPKDWSHIDPKPNIRHGSCAKEWVENFSDYAFCRVKPDLDLIIYGLNHLERGQDD